MARPPKDPSELTERLGLSLPPSYVAALKASAASSDRSVSAVVKRLMERGGIVPDPNPPTIQLTATAPSHTITATTVDSAGTRESTVSTPVVHEEEIEGSAAWRRRMLATGQADKIKAFDMAAARKRRMLAKEEGP